MIVENFNVRSLFFNNQGKNKVNINHKRLYSITESLLSR